MELNFKLFLLKFNFVCIPVLPKSIRVSEKIPSIQVVKTGYRPVQPLSFQVKTNTHVAVAKKSPSGTFIPMPKSVEIV